MPAPCPNCPFRKDCLKGWLGAERMAEIIASDSFVCHKTSRQRIVSRRQCAGHMLLLGARNAFVRMSTHMRLLLRLSGRSLVFDTEDDCIRHHAGE